MINLFKKLFIKNYQNTADPAVRLKYGTVGGILGIVTNLVLFAGKFVIGIISASVAIMADAMNNLTDAGSSLLTILGFKLSARPADEEHPYGHARYEYIAGFLIACLVMLIGFELAKSSIEKMISGSESTFSYVTIAVLALAILLKVWQGRMYFNFGKAVSSETLIAAGTDSRNDVISTSAVLVATLFSMFTSISIDAYVGLAVAIYILVSGLGLIKSTINPIIGMQPNKELTSSIIDAVMAHPVVMGVHDFVIHSYGASQIFATLHAEVDAKSDVIEAHDAIDNIEREIKSTFGVELVIHMDPTIFDDEEANMLSANILNVLKTEVHENINIHEMRLVRGSTHTNVLFDVVVPFGCKFSEREIKAVVDAHLATYPTLYYSVLTFDRNYVC